MIRLPPPSPLIIRSHARRLTLAATLVLSLGVLVAALVGPAQTLAQTRETGCSTSTARAKAKRTTRACTQSSRKSKSRSHGKHALEKTSKRGSDRPAAVAALCEDGGIPTRGADGGFSCADGSEPTCESGAAPRTSRNGKSLICPIIGESEAGAGESGAGEAECEEEGLECTGIGSAPSEQSCEASASEGASSACEAEG